MKIAIYGYGNIGRGVETSVKFHKDIELLCVFTRRDPATIQTKSGVPVYSVNDILDYKDKIDVLIVCGGSATELLEMTPELTKNFNVVDSFDTHAKIPLHFATVDKVAKESGHVALIAGGWDPGLFSVNRLYASAVLPEGKDYTFWGKGVSQGHSNVIKTIDGVLDACQYTVPIEEAVEAVRTGKMPELTARQRHRRECFVVVTESADKTKIENEIRTMPNYFADYDTTVTFVTAEEFRKNYSEFSHGGMVIRTGKTSEKTHTIEYRLTLDSNPEFTSSALLALARAVNKKYVRGEYGCITMFDIAPADLSPLSDDELRAKIL
ncbi:MAG: diaminopimelate dehydrogenase [Ruminococcaceae bacterium]|nr:diaminopimelate dehydrogenase [Oscillospiraceae bacterium]